jgi:hypothetical protein
MKGNRMTRLMILAAAWLLTLAPAAFAHSFNVVMAVPPALAQDIRNDMATAFMVASEETDSHANADSDGHLGGLDVYITLAGANEASKIAAARPDILSLPLRGDTTAKDAALLGPMDAATPAATAFLADAAGPGLTAFADRFAARTGQRPGPEATAAYLAARQIDRAVRALGGVDDRAALQNLLNGK